MDLGLSTGLGRAVVVKVRSRSGLVHLQLKFISLELDPELGRLVNNILKELKALYFESPNIL